uniref:TIR domain-containing protein n=1 Tax=Rhizophora mucronata TaxID=61149 RepID=A0A2P2MP95_RHIMU
MFGGNGPVSSAPAPVAALRFHWDVFVSFHGEDTGSGFIRSLRDSLHEHGIRAFLKDVGMRQGDEISPSPLDAIEDSAISIIIISPRYANSHDCLDELARITELKRLLLPVFYQVEPSHVRGQKGPFEQDFRNHLMRFGEDKVKKWGQAMTKVGAKKGSPFDSSKEEQLIRQLITRVLTELRSTPVGIATYTVGLDSRVERLLSLLDIKSKRIQVVGLHGMGGIGKTTLATALYNKVIAHFQYRSFMSNVRETCQKNDGLISLQNKLVGDLSSNGATPVNDVDAGISAIKQIVWEKRVLIVLDDVDDIKQLDALAGSGDWFGEGSRVIITTRNKEVLFDHIVDESYEVRELDSFEALQLFSYHAFRREKPTGDFLNLSKQIVSLTGGLPLALEVFGSFLLDKRRIEEWEDALKRLQQIRPHNLQDVLRISFDGLDEDIKDVFLDIACLFVSVRMNREEAIDILKGCGFRAEIAITVLAAKSLMKIGEDFTLWMHDQVRDMARQIVQEENLSNPGMCSRLWDHSEIMSVLKYKEGSKNVQGIILEFRKQPTVQDPSADVIYWKNLQKTPNFNNLLLYLKETYREWLANRAEEDRKVKLHTKYFQSMENLRLLRINHAKLEGKFEFLPTHLKWLQWQGCPLKSLPYSFSPRELAVLDLSESKIEQLWGWGSNMMAKNLTVLNLHHCHSLVSIPDLSGLTSLEKLNLEGCTQLTKIHNSVGNIKMLLYLNLKRCSNLVVFPKDVSGLTCLQKLFFSECSKLRELPDNLGCMSSLKELLIDGTAISKLPESLDQLTNLERLSLDGCKFIKQLPQCLGNLLSLNELSLNHSKLEELPDSVGSLSNLEKLSLIWCDALNAVPESVGNLQSLTQLFLDRSSIKELPAAICSLPYLKELSAGGCKFLSKLPDSLDGLASLIKLHLDQTPITGLPDQIDALKMIEILDLRNCKSLSSLPEAIGRMLNLTRINLTGINITELPESFGMLENLVILRLNDCERLLKLPASIGNLKSLHHLWMERTSVTELPESFGLLASLMILRMMKVPSGSFGESKRLVVLPTSFCNLTSLEELDARAWRISGRIPDDFEKLSKLDFLNLGYNNFCSLPSSLKSLSLLKKLYLPDCEELKSLPSLPSSLEELNVENCIQLESISDISNLESLELLNLANCERVVNIPGLECLKSLKRLYLAGCKALSVAIKRRLSKVCLRRMHQLSMPGSEIPNWFSQEITFSEHRNHQIRAVIIAVVVSIDHQEPVDLRVRLPAVPDVQARILKFTERIFSTALYLSGILRSCGDQMHMRWYSHRHPLVSQLKDGYKIEVGKRDPPVVEGIDLKKHGIYLVYENDDDYGGSEETLDESQQSVSQRLAKFFNSIQEDGHVS